MAKTFDLKDDSVVVVVGSGAGGGTLSNELVQRGINVVGVLGHPPGWATPYSGDDANGFSFYPPDPDRFAAYAYAVVSRYGRYVHHWEVWNEPDIAYWKGTPEEYFKLYDFSVDAVLRALPDARVLPIGTSARVGGTSSCEVEAMEGFAVLRAARLAGVPAVEVRAVSNEIDEPDRARWRFDDALAALEAALPRLLSALDA